MSGLFEQGAEPTNIDLKQLYGDGYQEIKESMSFMEAVTATNFVVDCQLNEGKGVWVSKNGGTSRKLMCMTVKHGGNCDWYVSVVRQNQTKGKSKRNIPPGHWSNDHSYDYVADNVDTSNTSNDAVNNVVDKDNAPASLVQAVCVLQARFKFKKLHRHISKLNKSAVVLQSF
jgi:hypothetical protein